jgi:hypothetical protein
MGRKAKDRPGYRISVYLDADSGKIAKDIENLSAFVQLSLRQAAGIMAFDILQRQRNLPKDEPPTLEAIAQFNSDYPLNDLTRKRLKKRNKQWPITPHSPQTPDVLS